jgi:hypothetical protein
MARYALRTPHAFVEYGSKKTAVKYGEESGESYDVLSPAGAIVASKQVEEAEDKRSYRDFPGNYSIAMIPFVETLAEAFGGITVEQKIGVGSSKLTRRAWLAGTKVNVAAFTKLLDRLSIEVMDELHTWQKANTEKRKGLSDMEKYLEHRKFIVDFAKKAARKIKSGELS